MVAQRPFLFVINIVVLTGIVMMMTVRATTDAPMFIFGDSNVDVGTNNFVTECGAKANHPYNGIDFYYSTPTGRFSNGKNIVDHIVRLLGSYQVLSPPPFLALVSQKLTFNRNILRGVNFASGGAGIFNDTGRVHFHKVITLEEQIQQFATVRENITTLLGSPKAADDLLQSSIYIFNIGSNELIEYPFNHSISDPAELKQYIANATQAYAVHLTNMYKLGARKFAIIGIAPLGCAPAARIRNPTGGCAEFMNDGAKLFQVSMQYVLTELSLMLEGFKFSLGNMYTVTMNVIDNPRGNGFKEVKSACCGNGTTDCEVGVTLCSNRDDYLFWDKFHPTEKASELAALALVYGEGSEYVTPMNFSSLAMYG
ncbi:hypothetical protein QVD17_09491 [Tagetes erecta]|uniref:Uncharacterized protein n=1 Tax=Tagetes erecta TaxID=13708 RepID=A0AAD8L1K2_TARER|nr:hypothetical protein QVD17_09491 [Tagetes erecta]